MNRLPGILSLVLSLGACRFTSRSSSLQGPPPHHTPDGGGDGWDTSSGADYPDTPDSAYQLYHPVPCGADQWVWFDGKGGLYTTFYGSRRTAPGFSCSKVYSTLVDHYDLSLIRMSADGTDTYEYGDQYSRYELDDHRFAPGTPLVMVLRSYRRADGQLYETFSLGR